MQPDWRAMVGHKTFDQLYSEAVQRLKEKGSRIVTNLNWGPFRILLSLFLEAVAVIYDFLADVLAPSGFTQYAMGPWLDEGVKDRGLVRRAATQAEGRVTFGRSAAGAAVPIPAGTVVKTDPLSDGESLSYVTTVAAILPSGALSVDVPVRAEFAGSAYNVSAGAIRHLVTHVPGIETVTNGPDWLTREGADEETDDELRARAQMAWQRMAGGGTEAAYRAWALEIPGVVDAVPVTGEPRGPGTLDIIVTSTVGVPTTQLLNEVQAHIDQQKPLLDNVLVKGPSTKVIDVDVELTLPPIGGDEAMVQAEAERRIRAIFALDSTLTPRIEPLKPSQGLNVSRIIWELRIAPVENVTVNLPAADEPAIPGQLLVLGNLTVTVVRR